jgi:hypothetical protein
MAVHPRRLWTSCFSKDHLSFTLLPDLTP